MADQQLRDTVTPGSTAEQAALADFRAILREWQDQRAQDSEGCEWDAVMALAGALGTGLDQAVAMMTVLCPWHWDSKKEPASTASFTLR